MPTFEERLAAQNRIDDIRRENEAKVNAAIDKATTIAAKYLEMQGYVFADVSNNELDALIVRIHKYLEFPDLTPEKEHQDWVDARVSQGWQYGEVLDYEAQTHPMMIPYNELPEKSLQSFKALFDTINSNR